MTYKLIKYRLTSSGQKPTQVEKNGGMYGLFDGSKPRPQNRIYLGYSKNTNFSSYVSEIKSKEDLQQYFIESGMILWPTLDDDENIGDFNANEEATKVWDELNRLNGE